MILLDTNVISEPTRKRPDARVQQWLAAQPDEGLFLSVITIGELRQDILMLGPGKKRRDFLRWLETEVKSAFSGRILPIDDAVMERWAELGAKAKKAGRGFKSMDALLAATALAHGFTLATRNISDFAGTGVALLNPWEV